MPQPRKKRRLFSFSLRALLIAVLVLGGLFGWLGIRYRRMKEQRAILDRIEASGGKTFIGDEECQPSNRDLFFDGSYIHRIERVTYGIIYAAPDLEAIALLKNLQELELYDTTVSDLAPLSGLKKLKVLDLSGTNAKDLAPLRSLKNLESLTLDHTRVTNLAPLSGLTNLKSLNLSSTMVFDLAPLRGLTNLQELDLLASQATVLSPLAELKNLKVIAISEVQWDYQSIAFLREALPNCKIAVHFLY